MASKIAKAMSEPSKTLQDIVTNSTISVWSSDNTSGEEAVFVAPVHGVLIFQLNNEGAWYNSKTANISVQDQRTKAFIAPVHEKAGSTATLTNLFLYGTKGLIDGTGTLVVAENNTFTVKDIPKAKIANIAVPLTKGQAVDWKMQLEGFDIKFQLTFQMDWVQYQDEVTSRMDEMDAQNATKRADLEKKIKTHRSSLTLMQKESDLVKSQKEETQKKLIALTQTHDQLTKDQVATVAKLNEVEPRIGKLQSTIISKEKEISAKEDKVLEYQNKVLSLSEQVQRFEAATAGANELKRTLAKAIEKEAGLQKQLQTVTAQVTVEVAARRTAEKTAKEHVAVAQQLKGKVEQVTARVGAEVSAKAAAEKEAQEHKAVVQKLQLELQTVTAKVEAATNMSGQQTVEVQNLQAELQTIAAEKAAEEAAKRVAEENAEEHAAAVQSLQSKLQTLTARVTVEKEATAAAEKATKEHEALVQTHQNKVETLMAQAAESEDVVEAKKQEWQTQMKAWQTQMKALGSQVAEQKLAANTVADDYRGAYSALSERANKLELENNDLQQLKNVSAGAAAKMLAASKGLKGRNKDLEKELKKKDQAIAELKKMLEILQKPKSAGTATPTGKSVWELHNTINRVVIWVDDTPSNNQPYVDLVLKSGISVLQISSTEATLAYLGTKNGQALLASRDAAVRIITNMTRGSKENEGIRLALKLRDAEVDIPIMIFTSKDESLQKARAMRKELGVQNVVETNEAEKALDFAYFNDRHIELRSPMITAASKSAEIEFPSLDLKEWSNVIERVSEMGYDDVQFNLDWLEENKVTYPHSTEIQRIEALVDALSSRATK